MIYLLDDNNVVVDKFTSALDASNKLCIGKSWIYEKMKNTPHGEFECNGMRFIRAEDREESIKIGDGGFKGDEGNYSFNNGVYSWKSRGVGYEIDKDLADKLFFEFSSHGLALSQAEVRLKNGLSLREWYSLKGRLQLYKDSDILSPESRKDYTDDEYRKLAAKKINDLNTYRKRAVIDEYTKYHVNNAKKWRDKANEKTFNQEFIVSELAEWLDKQACTIKLSSENLAAKGKPIVAATADWHFGAGIDKKYTNPDYNPVIVRKLVNKFVDSINERMASGVTVVLDGDFIESWMGLNHPDSWQSIEKGHIGAVVVEKVIENMLEPIIRGVHNLDKIIAVGGNHDRGTNNNKEDNLSQVAGVIFYFLQRFYPNIEITYDPYCIDFDAYGLHYIVQHGYHSAAYKGKQAGDALVNDYGSPDLFNVVLTGDKHTRGVLMDSWNRRHLKIPPMFTGNFYSTTKGFSAVSGCLFIEEEDGLPQVIDKSFYSLFNEKVLNKSTI